MTETDTSLRRHFFTGTGIGILTGAILTAVGLLTSTEWQISALVGLMALLITILITALFAFAERLDEIDRRRVSVEPLQHLYKAPQLEQPLVRIVDAVASTQDKRSPFLKVHTTRAVERFSRTVSAMAEGSFVCSSEEEEVELVRDVLAETQGQVRAVASRGAEWWQKPEADVYFHAYEDAARRIAITRIFLVERDQLERVLPVLERHARAGIHTYALDLTQVPEVRRRGMIIFDNTLLHRAAARREGPKDPKDVEFTDVPEEIRRAENDYEFLLGLATNPTHDHSPTLFSSAAR